MAAHQRPSGCRASRPGLAVAPIDHPQRLTRRVDAQDGRVAAPLADQQVRLLRSALVERDPRKQRERGAFEPDRGLLQAVAIYREPLHLGTPSLIPPRSADADGSEHALQPAADDTGVRGRPDLVGPARALLQVVLGEEQRGRRVVRDERRRHSRPGAVQPDREVVADGVPVRPRRNPDGLVAGLEAAPLHPEVVAPPSVFVVVTERDRAGEALEEAVGDPAPVQADRTQTDADVVVRSPPSA